MKKYILIIVLPTLSSICHAQQYEVGTTVVIWRNPVTADSMRAKMQGAHYIEVALNQHYRRVPAEEVIPCIRLMRNRVDGVGIQVQSTHLSFSRTLDISVLDGSLRTKNIRFMTQMVGQCGQSKPAQLVLRPSSEPITDSVHARRTVNAQRSIMYLRPYADRIEARLCIENPPRTCLGNTPKEFLEITRSIPGVKICLDTNHYSKGPAEYSMRVLSWHIGAIHASDFDLVNESYQPPTQGKIDWQRFVRELRSNGYKGVLVYEATKDCDHDKVCPVPSRICGTFKNIVGSE